jgi:uncharacterized protein (DUF2164 family)
MMDKIEFSKQDKSEIVSHLRRYFSEELEFDISGLQGDMLLEFLSDRVGPYFYNRGLLDAHAAILRRLEDAAADIDVLEKPLR